MKAVLLMCFSVMFAGCSKSQQPPTSLQYAQSQGGTEQAPASFTANTPESIPKQIFPNAPKTVRKVDCFRSFARGISMYAVVQKCGRPDRELGSGIGIFVYDLDDGTSVSIRSNDINHIIDIQRSNKSGKFSSLLTTK